MRVGLNEAYGWVQKTEAREIRPGMVRHNGPAKGDEEAESGKFDLQSF